MNIVMRTIFSSSFLVFSLGVNANAVDVDIAVQPAPIEQPKIPAKTTLAEKKLKAEFLKTVVDVATNKMLIAAIGIALLIGGPLTGRIGEYIGGKYGKIMAYSKGAENFFLRCYNLQLSRNEKISYVKAMELCNNPNLTLADIGNLENEVEQLKLMVPANAYWNLSWGNKGKHLGHLIAAKGIDALSSGVIAAPLVVGAKLFNKKP